MIREMERALDALSERQRVVANNLANANTPGFGRKDVDFFTYMRDVYAGQSPRPAAQRDATATARLDGNNVSLEREMFAVTQTDLLYHAASQFATGALKRLRYAITDGRG